MAAALGLEVVGIDHAPAAIERAREKAAGLGLSVRFIHGDVLELANLGRAFATVIDSGTFHVFDDTDRDRYVRSLAASLQPGGVLHLLCFSEHTAGTEGPRRVTQAEIRDAFADGWSIERIVAEAFEVTEAWPGEPPRAWLARIVRDRR